VIQSGFSYGGKSVLSAYTIFDTGTEPYSYLEDPTAAKNVALLASGTAVSVSTFNSFNYGFTVSDSENLTYVESTKYSGSEVSIISLEYFLNNEYLLDFANHRLGLKNN